MQDFFRIAYVINWWPPNHDGGDSVFARDLAVGLNEKVTPIVFTSLPQIDKTYEFEDSGLKVVYLGNDWHSKLSAFLYNIELVHFFQTSCLPIVKYIKNRKDVPILFHMEMSFKRYSEMFEPDYDRNKYHRLEKIAVELSDKLIVPCNNELKHIARLYPFTNTVTIPNGINYNLRLQNSLELPKREGKTNFAFIGRLDDPMKGGDTLIKAIDQLPLGYLDMSRFIFIGCRDTRFLNQLNTLGEHVRYEMYPWISDELDLWDKLSDVHFMLIPSKYETFGMVCLESMAMGIVPIASSAGAMGEMITDNVNGFYVNSLNNMPKNLARAIIQSIDMNNPKFENMRIVSIIKARRDYNIEKVVDDIVPLYYLMRGCKND